MGRWILCAALIASGAGGCGGARLPILDSRGFRDAELEYRIDRGSDGALVGEAWEIDNLRLRSDGAIAARKVGPDYRIRRRLDADGDGDVEVMPETDAYDLRFRHRRDAGVMWVRTLALPPALAHTELRVLMRYYVDGIAGGGVSLTDLGSGSVVIEERRFATRELASEPIVVAGREALASTIEVANVDQLELSPDAVWERARVVFVRTDLIASVTGSPDDWELAGPVLMMIGYSNLPEDFDAHLAELEALLSRVRFETPESESAASGVLACFPDRAAVPVLVDRSGMGFSLEGYDACLQRAVDAADLEAQRSYGFRRADTLLSPSESPVPAPSENENPSPQ